MPIHKLADGPIVMTVAGVQTGLPSKFNPEQTQVRLTSDAGEDVYLNEVTALKQLARIALDFDSVIGRTVHIEQVKKNGTTFTNINLASPGSAGATPANNPATQSYPATAAPRQAQSLADVAAMYAECVSHAMATLGAKCEEAGIPVDASAIQAAAATLLIQMRGR